MKNRGEKITFWFLFFLMFIGFNYLFKLHYENNVLPNMSIEDKREMEYLKSLSLVESLKVYIKGIEVNGFHFLKQPGEKRYDRLGE